MSGRRAVAVIATVACLLAIGVFFRVREQPVDSGAAARIEAPPASMSTVPSSATSEPSAIPGVGSATPSPRARKVTAPVHLDVASIGVNTDLEALKILADGSLQAPSRWDEAGWYSGGVAPGEIGPAVIAGHIDSTRGPAVFYRLRELVAGSKISIIERDGAVLHFTVDNVQSYPKDEFPTAAVYGPTPNAELRLITCTGEFDYAAHSYLSNLVVSAHLAGGAP